MYTYDRDFYRSIEDGALASAGVVVPLLCSILEATPRSVLDVGCGAGAWLACWRERGCSVTGVDGHYVDREALLIAHTNFVPHDLREALHLGENFDLVQCLEVAEHLPATSADRLVDSLCRHGDTILFSAAPPGQGGENHVNERPYEYWRDLFARRGFHLYDALRPGLHKAAGVKHWYRYNSFLYLREGIAMPDSLQAHKVPACTRIPDVSPSWYRLRKRIIRMLPTRLSTMIAVLKKALGKRVTRFWQ